VQAVALDPPRLKKVTNQHFSRALKALGEIG
jgi:hypothetical protein